jgi:CDGSH-type Zn-finger protein
MAEGADPSLPDPVLTDLSATIAELQREVSRLRAKDDIRDLIVRYAKACDVGNDPVRLAPLFTLDASWECKGFGRYEGRDTVAKALKAIAGSRIWWSLHYMISPEIVLDADGQGATLFWYLWEAATLPNEYSGKAEAYWIGATYDGRARLVDGAWLFSAMELKLTLASPFSQGWVEKRFPDGTPSQPYFVHLPAGEHTWCACGKSKSQPFCDGSHAGGRAQPMPFTTTIEGTAVLCGCRYSRTKPFCDGSHLNLKL